MTGHPVILRPQAEESFPGPVILRPQAEESFLTS